MESFDSCQMLIKDANFTKIILAENTKIETFLICKKEKYNSSKTSHDKGYSFCGNNYQRPLTGTYFSSLSTT